MLRRCQLRQRPFFLAKFESCPRALIDQPEAVDDVRTRESAGKATGQKGLCSCQRRIVVAQRINYRECRAAECGWQRDQVVSNKHLVDVDGDKLDEDGLD